MPMYNFVCRDCGQAFDKKLRMSQAGDPQTCPACGGDTRKRIGAVASVGGRARSAAPAVSVPPASSPFS